MMDERRIGCVMFDGFSDPELNLRCLDLNLASGNTCVLPSCLRCELVCPVVFYLECGHVGCERCVCVWDAGVMRRYCVACKMFVESVRFEMSEKFVAELQCICKNCSCNIRLKDFMSHCRDCTETAPAPLNSNVLKLPIDETVLRVDAAEALNAIKLDRQQSAITNGNLDILVNTVIELKNGITEMEDLSAPWKLQWERFPQAWNSKYVLNINGANDGKRGYSNSFSIAGVTLYFEVCPTSGLHQMFLTVADVKDPRPISALLTVNDTHDCNLSQLARDPSFAPPIGASLYAGVRPAGRRQIEVEVQNVRVG